MLGNVEELHVAFRGPAFCGLDLNSVVKLVAALVLLCAVTLTVVILQTKVLTEAGDTLCSMCML